MSRQGERRCLRLDEWPDTDRIVWHDLFRTGDLLDRDQGAGSRWSPATIHKYRRGYGRWLDFLARSGRLHADERLGDRVSPQAVSAYVEHLQHCCAPFTVFSRLAELCSTIRVVAPDGNWAWLQRLVSRLRRIAQKQVGIKDTVSSARLFDWSLRELTALAEAIAATVSSIGQAAHYRNVLMVGFLSSRPIRMRNLAMIGIGHHLIRKSSGYDLAFASHETKTGTPIETSVPDDLTEPMDFYIEQARPILARGNETARLWLNQYGTPMNEQGLYRRIVKVTEQDFGHRINPHRFRDCVATTIAIEDPKHAQIIAPILGHSTMRTAERHYNQAPQLDAARDYQAAILSLRRRLSATPPD
jgi:integrase/recombinase XerD